MPETLARLLCGPRYLVVGVALIPEELAWFLYSTGYLVVGVLALYLSKKAFDFATPYSVDVQLTEKDNPALGVLMTGFLLGITAVLCSVFAGDTTGPTLGAFTEEMVEVLIYGALGIVLLFVAGIVNDRLILHRFSNRKEVIEGRNVAVGVIMAFTYTGAGLVIAGAIYGSTDILSAVVMFACGQLTLVIFAWLYQKATRYDEQEQLGDNQNLAVGLAFGGNIMAYSLILMKGAMIDPAEAAEWTWADRLLEFGYFAVAGCVLLVIAHVVTDRVFLPKVRIADEIVKDRNVNAGLIGMALALAVGAVLVFCL